MPFTPGGGYTRSTSELQTAQSWIMKQEEISTIIRSRRESEPGPGRLILRDNEIFDLARNLKYKMKHSYQPVQTKSIRENSLN